MVTVNGEWRLGDLDYLSGRRAPSRLLGNAIATSGTRVNMHRAVPLAVALVAIGASVVAILSYRGSPRQAMVDEIRGRTSNALRTAGEPAGAPLGSPARTVLTWFDGVRENDPPSVVGTTLASEVVRVWEILSHTGDPNGRTGVGAAHHVRVVRRGGVRSVRIIVLGFSGTNTVPVTQEFMTLEVERAIDGKWRVANVDYLLDAARRLRRDG